MKRVSEEKLEQVRSNREGVFIQAKDENLPAFLAFVDLDTAVNDSAVAEYAQIMERIEKYFKGDTRKDIVRAVFTIRAANTYYPDLNCLQSLRYLNDCVRSDFDPKTSSDSATTHVGQMGDEINQMLVLKFYELQIEAMKQQQAQQEAAQTAQNEYQAWLNETINQNLEKARAYGAARNAERAAAAPQPIYGGQSDYRDQASTGRGKTTVTTDGDSECPIGGARPQAQMRTCHRRHGGRGMFWSWRAGSNQVFGGGQFVYESD